MSAFCDATCPKCGKRFGWQGELIDKPPCPRCGWTDSLTSLKSAQEEMDAKEEEIRKRLMSDTNEV